MSETKPSGNPEKPAAEIWWGEGNDLRCGRVTGRITSGGWRWNVSSGGAIWLWLNREGSGLVWGENDRFILKPGMYAMTGGGKFRRLVMRPLPRNAHARSRRHFP